MLQIVTIKQSSKLSSSRLLSDVRGTTEGECSLISKHVHRQLARCNPLFHILNVLVPTGFVLVSQIIIIIIIQQFLE